MFDKIHEECGVFGVYADKKTDVAGLCYYGLFALQHRGQESCGIYVNDDGVINGYKAAGIVNDVFTRPVLESLGQGSMALGHVRYGTAGSSGNKNAQPVQINHIKGSMALAYNGNIANAMALREKLESTGSIFHTTGDAEVIAYVVTRERMNAPSIEAAVSATMKQLVGAYSILLMSPRKLVAARDPMGFHPLCIGRKDGMYVVASETCALDSVGAKFLRDVEPGEIMIIDEDGVRSDKSNCIEGKKSLCVFEFVYFARPDSVVDGSSVHIARRRAGAMLALRHPVNADVVIGTPDSGIDAAIGYANESGIPYAVGLIKNKYIGRTFIDIGQDYRMDRVKIKLNAVSAVVKDKRVILVDDSIVRGTTSARIVKMLKDAGAKEVHLRISSPPFLYPCYFGTDIDSQDVLIACKHPVEEIAKIVVADSLGYLAIEDMPKLAYNTKLEICDACFTGEYPIDVPKEQKSFRFEKKISE